MNKRCVPSVVLLIGVLLGAGGCQVDLPVAGPLHATSGALGGEDVPGEERRAEDPAVATPPEASEGSDNPWREPTAESDGAAPPRERAAGGNRPLAAQPGVEAGIYADDPRWPALARTWFDRVERAFERVAVVTGLDFGDRSRPRVTLRAFRDEARTHELRAEVLEGHRRVVVHVNSEPLISGVLDADLVLRQALAEAAFQEAVHRHGSVPRWFVLLAGIAAAGDTEARLVALYRRAVERGEDALRIDSQDPSVAEASGLAALVLLAAQGEPKAIRRVIGFVADGDSADEVLGRVVGAGNGGWVEKARAALGERLASVDPEPWLLLRRARAALAETGRAGLEAVVPETPPAEVADVLKILAARAALAEGDTAAARAGLRSLSPQAMQRVGDPAAMIALRIDVESRSGGDAQLARRLVQQLDRDFPTSAATRAVADAHPLLGLEEDPQRWLRRTGERVARDGHAVLDLDTLQGYLRMLVMDHRAGAAQRLLESLGLRGTAPELETMRATVEEAQRVPSGAGLAQGEARVAAWERKPTEASRRDVRESGAAAEPALRRRLTESASGAQRTATIALLAETVSEADAVDLVRALWPGAPGRVHRDLHALGSVVAYPALERVLDSEALGEAEAQALAKAWSRLTLGLSRRWLSNRPSFLRSLHHPEFTVRRAAFEQIGREAPSEATPSLVAFGLKDRAALLRREAVALAGLAGFRALARRALQDEAWVVREEAVRAVVRVEAIACVPVLIEFLRDDPSREVRAAAALALLRAAPSDDRAIDALLASQLGEEARLRDAIGARLAELPPEPIVRGIVRGWRRAAARAAPDRGYLFRTALLYGRLTKQAIGYYPGATSQEMRGMLVAMQAWLRERAEQSPDGGADDGRIPAGRER